MNSYLHCCSFKFVMLESLVLLIQSMFCFLDVSKLAVQLKMRSQVLNCVQQVRISIARVGHAVEPQR